MQHGACLGIGLLCMATADERIYDELTQTLLEPKKDWSFRGRFAKKKEPPTSSVLHFLKPGLLTVSESVGYPIFEFSLHLREIFSVCVRGF